MLAAASMMSARWPVSGAQPPVRSAAPRPVFRDRLCRRAKSESPRAHGVELPTGFCLLLRSKPLPLGGHTNRSVRPEASGPVFYSTFFAPGGPKPPKFEGGEVRTPKPDTPWTPPLFLKPVLNFLLARPRAVQEFFFG